MFNSTLVKEVKKATKFKLTKFFNEHNYEFTYYKNNHPLLGLVIDLTPNDRIYYLQNTIIQVKEWDFISLKEAHELADKLLEYERLYILVLEQLKPIVEKYKLHLI